MLIRYPGSKDRHLSRILPALRIEDRRLCEPFAGTASVTFACIREGRVDKVWINDADRNIADLWSTIRDYPAQLCDRVRDYEPTADSFYELRERQSHDPSENAFATVVLHQISYSGLGRRAGSPIGGRNQTGAYKVGCRWNADRLIAGISEAHGLLNKVHSTVTSLDWSDCPEWTWYVDPPYYVAGSSLYREGKFEVGPLADFLRAKEDWWALSYDRHDEIQAAYHWAHVDDGGATYLGTGKKSELLITPRDPQTALFRSPSTH